MLDRLGIGDNLNDTPVFHQAGVGVATGHAPAAAKRAATAVAPGND